MLPVSAGLVEDELKTNHNIFLYLYSPECGACRQFNSRYANVSRLYAGTYRFYKFDINTEYGRSLLYKYNGHVLPYVIMLNGSKQRVLTVPYPCLMNELCLNTELKNFQS